MHPGDGAPDGLPLLQANVDRGAARAGFAIPVRRAWRDALGPAQLRALWACGAVRYPRRPRVMRAFWRGSNTDRAADPMDEANALDAARTRLHLLGRWHADVLDAALTGWPQAAFDNAQCVDALLPLGARAELEDAGRYALALDLDGNGWSDRLRALALAGTTPILKQATNVSGFGDHLFPPRGAALEAFAPDLRDLAPRAEALLAEAATEAGAARLWAMVDRSRAVAALALSQLGAIEATAFAMARAAELSDWRVVQEPGYEEVPFARCCPHAPALPRRFVEAVRATTRSGGGGGGRSRARAAALLPLQCRCSAAAGAETE